MRGPVKPAKGPMLPQTHPALAASGGKSAGWIENTGSFTSCPGHPTAPFLAMRNLPEHIPDRDIHPRSPPFLLISK
jgi:hypothetical protein